MSFTKMTTAVNNISQLSDRPNDDGMNAAQLKAAFDQAGGDIKTFVNSLIDELEATTAAGSVGIDTIAYDADTPAVADATTVQEGLAALYKAISNAVISGISDGAVSTAKLADGAVTTAKIADSNVTTAKVADANITAAKLATDAVETAKIKDINVTTAKLADAAVTSVKLGAKAVTTAKIDDAAVDTAQIKDEAVTLAKTTGIQPAHVQETISIPAISANGTQTVTCYSVGAHSAVIVSPDADSWQKWRDCGVRCTAQGNTTLTFKAETATGQTLSANVLVLDGGVIIR